MSSTEKTKVIQINPDFFSLSKNKTSKNKTLKKKKELPSKPNIRNTLKKKLISNIRNFNKNKDKNMKETSSKPTTENINSSKDRLTEALSFLDKYLKDKNIQTKNEDDNNKITNVPKNTPTKMNNINQKTNILANKENKEEYSVSKTKEEPPYGCLKGGKKMTFSEYKRTLKKRNQLHNTTRSREKQHIKLNIEDRNAIQTERSKQLNNLKKIRQDKTNHIIENNHKRHIKSLKNQPRKKVKKYRIRTIRRVYNLGKKDTKVAVLIKSNKTIKQIKREINILEQIDINTMKKELRNKNLIRYGSHAPDTIIREIYRNSILSGDIKNKNSKYLIHNYLYQS